jgi:hypothetical protein
LLLGSAIAHSAWTTTDWARFDNEISMENSIMMSNLSATESKEGNDERSDYFVSDFHWVHSKRRLKKSSGCSGSGQGF